MTILSHRLALNLNYLLSCCIAFCCAAHAIPCHTTPLSSRHRLSPCAAPLLCWLVVASPLFLLRHHLSCTGCLLNCHLSPRIAASLYHAYHALRCSLDIVVAAPPSSPPLACHHHPPLEQDLLLARDAIIDLPVVEVERTRDEGG